MMQEALVNVPSLFAQCVVGRDPAFVGIRMTDSADGLEVSCVDPQDSYYKHSFSESELSSIRDSVDKSMGWDAFFSAIEGVFSSKSIPTPGVSVTMQGKTACTVVCDIKGKKASFPLPKGEAGGSVKLLEQLSTSCKLRTDDAFRQEYIASAEQSSSMMERGASQTVRGVNEIKTVVENSAANEKASQDRLLQLQNELKQLTAAGKKPANLPPTAEAQSGWKILTPSDALVTCPAVCRPPLRDAFHNQIIARPLAEKNPAGSIAGCLDLALLKAIKGKLCPGGGLGPVSKSGTDDAEQEKRDGLAHNVIKPLAPADLQSFCAGLTDKGRVMVMKQLEKLDSWNFDVFNVQGLTGGASLFVVSYALILKHNAMRVLGIDEKILINFLTQAEAGYHPNPYHNSTHAADVLHVLHYILSAGGMIKIGRLQPADVFAALLAALIHDYDHPGINNNYHVKTQTYLARLYSDRSILENHHASEIFELMKDPRFDVLASLNADVKRDIRDTVVDMVLSTDMGLHTKILGIFKRRFADEKEAAEKAGRPDAQLFKKKDDIRLTLAIAIKMADISNCGRPEQLYLRWAFKIADEFFLQGDRERNVGMTVSPFMDRRQPSMAKGQVAFMNYIVIPLFEAVSDYLPDMHFSIDLVEQNKKYWAQNDDSPPS